MYYFWFFFVFFSYNYFILCKSYKLTQSFLFAYDFSTLDLNLRNCSLRSHHPVTVVTNLIGTSVYI